MNINTLFTKTIFRWKFIQHLQDTYISGYTSGYLQLYNTPTSTYTFNLKMLNGFPAKYRLSKLSIIFKKWSFSLSYFQLNKENFEKWTNLNPDTFIFQSAMLTKKIIYIFFNFRNKFLAALNPFYVAGLFQYPLKTYENQRFSVFRAYRNRPVAWMGWTIWGRNYISKYLFISYQGLIDRFSISKIKALPA